MSWLLLAGYLAGAAGFLVFRHSLKASLLWPLVALGYALALIIVGLDISAD